MIDCPISHPALPALFEVHVPNDPALWAVFLGKPSGRAGVDNLEKPTQCVVRTAALLTYASRGIGQAFLAEAVDYYRHAGQIWLIHSPGDPPAPEGCHTLPRLEFYDYDPQSHILADFRSQLPSGFAPQRIDLNLLQRCEWRDDMALYCGSLENFLLTGLGLCLMHGDEIIVETYASALGVGYAEIGAITHEPYRGKG